MRAEHTVDKAIDTLGILVVLTALIYLESFIL